MLLTPLNITCSRGSERRSERGNGDGDDRDSERGSDKGRVRDGDSERGK
jgi:hypothetical protein